MDETLSPSSSGSFPPRTSLFNRLANVFAAPGDVFDEVRSSPACVANWIVPIVIVVAVTVASFALTLSQPTIKQQIVEMQNKAIDQQVAAGKIKAADAEKAKEFLEKLPPWVLQLAGVVQGILSGVFVTFWWALVLWFIGVRIFKGDFPFMKALESSGLAMMIFALAIVVTTLLIVVFGNLNARPSASVFLSEVDPTRKFHLLLGSINLFYIWMTGVLAVALARLSGESYLKAATWLFGFWIVTRGLFVAVGLGGFVQ